MARKTIVATAKIFGGVDNLDRCFAILNEALLFSTTNGCILKHTPHTTFKSTATTTQLLTKDDTERVNVIVEFKKAGLKSAKKYSEHLSRQSTINHRSVGRN